MPCRQIPVRCIPARARRCVPLYWLLLMPALLAAAPAPAVAAEPDQGRSIIVLDASGSMWGQVDGRTKIEIAREVFADLLRDWPAGRDLGVIAYGHRREGDCFDIEQVIDVGPVDAPSAIARIDAIKPKGKTPLTAAVEQAAEALRYRDEPATVILLTDGIETCDRDPCQLAATLEQAGVGFTAHVIGFDVAAKDAPRIACIAENTGGRFLSAGNADELLQAMRSVTVDVPPPAPAMADVELVAVDAGSGEELSGASLRLVSTGGSTETAAEGTGSLSLELAAGSYRVTASLEGAEAQRTIDIAAGGPQRVEVPIERPLPQATLEAPDEAAAGSELAVHWTGPDEKGDRITIAEAGAPDKQYNDYAYTSRGSPATLTAPDSLGTFELRYLYGGTNTVLARAPVTLTPVSATVEAPAEVAAGSDFEVHWTGPANKGDSITIAEAGAPEGKYSDYAYTSRGSPARLTAPDALGSYEVRYLVGQSKRVLAIAPVTLTPVRAELAVPGPVLPGAEFSVNWVGPDNKSDYIAIAEPGAPEGTYLDYTYTSRGSPATIEAPEQPGDYEVRYVIGQSKRTLASVTVTVGGTDVALTVDSPAKAGGVVSVGFTGPGRYEDLIEILPAEPADAEPLRSARASQGSPVQLFAPASPGSYRVRYRMSDTGDVLAEVPLVVD